MTARHHPPSAPAAPAAAGRHNKLMLLLRRNVLQRRRNLVSTLSELVIPLAFILLLVWLQHFDKDQVLEERDYTCPQQAAMSPTLLSSANLSQKASTRSDNFIFAVDTSGVGGAGMQTVPPFLYVLALLAKTQSKLALVAEDEPSRVWFRDKFVGPLDQATRPVEEDWRWQQVRKQLAVFDLAFCRMGKLVKYYNSSLELDEYVKSQEYGTGNWTLDKQHACPLPSASPDLPRVFAAIVLRQQPGDGAGFAYSLRMNFTAVPGTYPQLPFVDPLLVGVDSRFQDMYMLSGFLTLQLQMDRHIIGKKTAGGYTSKVSHDLAMHSLCDTVDPMLRDFQKLFPQVEPDMVRKLDCHRMFRTLTLGGMDLSPLTLPAQYVPNEVRFAPFPTPKYLNRPFYAKTEDVISLLLLLCYQWPTSRLIRGIVHEKESRLRESLLQMGVSLTEVMLSHIITYAVVLLCIAALITGVSAPHLFSQSDKSLVFAFFSLFGVNVVAFGCLVSVLFDRAKTASTAGVSLFFMTYLPYMALGTQQATVHAKSILSLLFAPTGFALGANVLVHYEASGEGVLWTNIHTAPSPNDLTFQTILLHLGFTCFMYFALAWYLNQVVSAEFGVVRKPWYFLLTRKYWCSSGSTSHKSVGVEVEEVDEEEDRGAHFERPTAELRQLQREGRCVQMHKLRKEFPSTAGTAEDGVKVAVNDVSACFYEGQISALLGPNGGGKTTLIRMLTGDLPCTTGRASAFGRDLFANMDSFRTQLGVCPQHDVLYEDLTVGEHLELVARLRGGVGMDVEQEVTASLRKIGMPEKRHRLSSSLSGGQKRKLSLAMALLGDSKLVFLDEPTSGMDSHSRRFVWNLLQESKHGRTIVLTTHFLDEADFLGDQILMVGHGTLQCSGSSHFLKQQYGVGYTLTVMGGQPQGQRVREVLPEAKLLSAMGSEITFQVPFASSSRFPELFAEFDSKQPHERWGYGVSVTTLDEVFVKVALEGDGNWAEAEAQRMQQQHQQVNSTTPAAAATAIASTSTASFAEQFGALVRKRAQYASRDRKSVCCNTFIPVLLLVMGLGMLKLFPLPEPPALVLDEPNAFQMSSPSASSSQLQVVVDSPQLAKYIPHAQAFDADEYFRPSRRTFDNNCSEEGSAKRANAYPDARASKAFSTYLRETRTNYTEHGTRLGAIHVTKHTQQDEQLVRATIFANSSAVHSTAVYLNVLSTALLRRQSSSNRTIHVSSHPLPFTARFQELLSTFSAVSASMSTLIAFSFIPATIAVYVVREREVSAKHQQLLAGTHLVAYWTSNFVFDYLMFCIPWAMAVLLVHVFSIHALETFALVVLFGAYGLAIVPFTYLTSFYFHSHSTAQNVVLLLNFITGMVLTITSFVLSMIPNTQHVNSYLEYVFRLFPGFCLGNGLIALTVNDSLKTFGDGVLIKAQSPFAWDVTGASLAFLVAESVVFLLLTLLVDFYSSDPYVRSRLQAMFSRGSSEQQQHEQSLLLDEDVAREVERIDSNGEDDEGDVVKCRHLRKVWPSTGQVAVQDLTVGIQPGQVFGLLGVNGSGKTSTLKMLSGEVLPTSGTATIAGLDILLDQQRVRRMIGYVPQFDALLDLLTVREHLELYGRLKGLRGEGQLETAVLGKMRALRLEEFEHQCSGALSGGNRRKLSVAVALIGDPKLILADEPTTGVDALNRRFLCDTLGNYSQATGAAVVLTTHSFEEIESLATRVGIMTAGQFGMLGTIQHLKQRFGRGVTFKVRLAQPGRDEIESLARHLALSARLDSVEAVLHALPPSPWLTTASEVFTETGRGWAVWAELQREGSVRASSLAAWWLAQEYAERMERNFVTRYFPQAELVEQQQQQQFTYRVDELPAGSTLGECFATFERHREEFKLQEYSIAGTSLESIFINLAQRTGNGGGGNE